jgi:8-oxo-dGTP pyrophosphatase MutT (NUDIX family)
MAPSASEPPNQERHLVATAFVCWRGKLLLHRHPKLAMWLPCGGHVEPGESPDEAAIREVHEESGVLVDLVGERALDLDEPRQLVRPRGVQLECIAPGHEHIDFIYFARPREPFDGILTGSEPRLGWYDPGEVDRLPLTEEMRAWTRLAFEELTQPPVNR